MHNVLNGIYECISSQERLSIFYEPTDRTNKLFHEIYVIPFCRSAKIAQRSSQTRNLNPTNTVFYETLESAEVVALLNLNRIIFWSQFEPGHHTLIKA